MPLPRSSHFRNRKPIKYSSWNTRRRSASLGLLVAREFRVRVAGEGGHPPKIYRDRARFDHRPRRTGARGTTIRGHTTAGETEGTALVLPVSRKGTFLPSRGREFRVIAERFSGERASRAYSYRFPTPWRVTGEPRVG